MVVLILIALRGQYCRFPDVAEALCRAHLDREDSLSALITAEWCALHLLALASACSTACSQHVQAGSALWMVEPNTL